MHLVGTYTREATHLVLGRGTLRVIEDVFGEILAVFRVRRSPTGRWELNPRFSIMGTRTELASAWVGLMDECGLRP